MPANFEAQPQDFSGTERKRRAPPHISGHSRIVHIDFFLKAKGPPVFIDHQITLRLFSAAQCLDPHEQESLLTPLSHNITHLLKEWSAGNERALAELTPLVYDELHQQAARYLRRERPGHSLQTTALINEAYLRLIDAKDVQWQSRTHFFAIAANLMRRILVDHARRRDAEKRGGSQIRLTLDGVLAVAKETDVDLLAIDEALDRLAAIDSQQARVVELRFFSGLSVDETAAALGVSPKTVKRDWSVARAWLRREIEK
jgi:RNA polymerase sigma factor (TIGR02999 family)